MATPGFEPGTSGCLVLHSTTMPRQLLVFTSGSEGGGIVLIGPVRDFLLATLGFEPGTSDL